MFLCAGEFRGRSLRTFIRYVTARIAKETDDLTYQIYVSDRLLEITNGLLSFSGGSDMNELRFIEIILPELFPKVPEKSAEEIVQETLSKHGLEVKME